jgi:uncharacterized protein
VTRFRSFRSLAFALSTVTATSALVGCKSEPPQIVVHTDKDVVQPGRMVVTGTATIQVAPDCADLNMTITGTAMRPGAAVDHARKKQSELFSKLKELGVEDGDLKLSTMNVSPEYEWVGNRNVFRGYSARITLTVTTKNFDQLGPLMEAGADAGVTEMASQFRRSDLDSLRKQVREQALLSAKDKAKQTATTLEIHLGKVSGVAETPNGYLFSNEYFPRSVTLADAQTAPENIMKIAAELQPLTLEITVTYDLA